MASVYDFHTLSPLDFEELVRDLLQRHWQCQLESFGPGRDSGIDIRYLNGPDQLIVQAKHYLGSGFPGILRAAKAENLKAAKLSPSRYLLATSVSLTPARKDQLVAAMPDVPLMADDILGQEDLNNLIRQHPEIEQQHFKLWLTSASVLERILHSGVYNRTAAELDIIRAMVPLFVQNQSVAEAEKVLAETGALIIAGQPGVGKTTLARILLWLHAEQSWNVFVVDDLDQAFEIADTREKRLIMFDDFLGQVRLSSDHVRGIDARLPPLLARVASHDNLRFILTTRDYILAQARTLSARLGQGPVGAREYVLNVGR
jgi:Restriction endonuclease